MESNKDRIMELLAGVERPGIGNVIRFLEESDFFTAQCHRHHRYPGGLADHSLEVYENLKALGDIPEESAVIAGLLHDVCTADHRSCRNLKGHGRRSVAILADVCGLELTTDERMAIRLHLHPMDGFGSRLCRALVLADNISAMFEKDKEPDNMEQKSQQQ